MAWKWKALALLVGAVSLASGAWPIAVVCFAYLAYSVRPGRGSPLPGPRAAGPLRYVLAAAMFLLSAAAFVYGGLYSPILFLSLGLLAVSYPRLVAAMGLDEVDPVEASILLRWRYLPYRWASLAELKPGPETLPRGAASYAGTLIVSTESGRAYSLATCSAPTKRDAEAKILTSMKSASPRSPSAAYLYPLDSRAAEAVLRQKLDQVGLDGSPLESAQSVRGIVVMDCQGGVVRRVAAYASGGQSERAHIPSAKVQVPDPPLLWEALDTLGKNIRWPDPDAISDLLDSLAATRGVPLAERLASLEAGPDGLSAVSNSGQKVRLTRPQLRALLSIYQ